MPTGLSGSCPLCIGIGISSFKRFSGTSDPEPSKRIQKIFCGMLNPAPDHFRRFCPLPGETFNTAGKTWNLGHLDVECCALNPIRIGAPTSGNGALISPIAPERRAGRRRAPFHTQRCEKNCQNSAERRTLSDRVRPWPEPAWTDRERAGGLNLSPALAGCSNPAAGLRRDGLHDAQK